MVKHHFMLCIMLIPMPAMAEYFDSNMYGDILNIADSTVVTSGAFLNFDKINITTSSYLQNHGVLSGDVFVADGRDVYIKNSGTIDGEITLGINASLTQIIHTPDDITDINVADNYNIIVYRAANLQWTDIRRISSAADKVVLVDSGIVLSPDIMLMSRAMPVPIELVGHNELHIKMADIDFNTPIFWRVTGSGTMHLHADDINPLYALRTVIRDGALYAELARETDYYKIMGNQTGEFLNALRARNPKDNLLQRLDQATDMPELVRIMNKSMRINTRALARPIQTFNRHVGAMHTDDGVSAPMQIAPFIIAGQNIDAYGIRAGLNIDTDKPVRASVTIHAADMNFTDGIDDYSAKLAGGEAYVRYDAPHIFADSGITITAARFATPVLQSGAATASDPSGFAADFYADAGPKILLADNMTLTPIVGLAARYANVIQHSTDINLRAGFIARHTHKTTDINYTYDARIISDNDGGLQADARIGLSLPEDDAIIYAGIGALHDNMGMSYSATLSLSFDF